MNNLLHERWMTDKHKIDHLNKYKLAINRDRIE
jgi:hypothetical protein